MRIALVLEHYDPRRGGTEQWTCRFVRTLLERGHQVHIVAADRSPLAPDGIIYHPFKRSRSPLRRGQAVAEVVRGLSVDLVHDMGIGWECDVLHPHGGCWPAAFEAGLKRLSPWLRPWKRELARWAPRYRELREVSERQCRPDGPLVLAVSPMVADHFRTLGGLPADRVRTVCNGIDIARFHPDARRVHRERVRAAWDVPTAPILLLAAHNFALKGVGTVLETLPRLGSGPGAPTLVVVGRGNPEPYLRRAQRLGVADRVRFPGPVDDMVPVYAAADLFVQPTYYDPCSLVSLEALAAGLPLVTTSANGVGRLLCDGREGLVLDRPDDIVGLADRIRRVLVTEADRPWSASARRLAEGFSWEDNAAAVLACYDEILSHRHAVRPIAA